MVPIREVKYRAWDIEDKVMRLVKSINYASDGFAGTVRVELVGKPHSCVHGESCVLLQYTGIKDVNDVEICEGDLLELEEFNGKYKSIVRFGVYGQDGSGGEYGPDEVLGFYIEALPNQLDRDGYSMPEEFEMTASMVIAERLKPRVIDNIFENPGILGQLDTE